MKTAISKWFKHFFMDYILPPLILSKYLPTKKTKQLIFSLESEKKKNQPKPKAIFFLHNTLEVHSNFSVSFLHGYVISKQGNEIHI